jgi:lipoprotein NlpI/transglutaminase-like putative cysteine protease
LNILQLPRVIVGLLLASALIGAGGQTLDQTPAIPVPAPTPLASPTPIDREVQIAEQAFTRDPTIPAWVEPVDIPDVKPKGPSTLLLQDSQTRVGDPVITFLRAASRINDPVALSSAGRVPINFIPDYQRIVLHTLRVWRDGASLDRLADAQIRFLQRETGLEQNLYSGVVTASILLNDVRVGDTVEVAYSVVGTNPVFGKTFSSINLWDLTVPIGLRHVTLLSPTARPIAWKAESNVNHQFPKPRERIRDGMRSLTFEEKDVEAIKPETLVPNGFLIARVLEFSEFASWQDVATWASSLFDATEVPDAARAALIGQWKALPSEEERVTAALEFVQSQVRYFSVSIGTSSHRPALPNTVLARRYGDCKDKSLLLVTLLADLGIHGEPVLARLNNRIGFDDWLPTPLAFDHVFVAVDVSGKRYFLDPTRLGQHGKLDRMGQVHDGAHVLVVSTATRGLERIRASNRNELAHHELAENLVVGKLDGPGELTVDQTFNGVGAEAMRVALGSLAPDRIETSLNTAMEKRYAGAKLIGHVEVEDDRLENHVHMHYRFAVPTPLQKVTEGWQVKFVPENVVRAFAIPAESERRAPVALSSPFDSIYRFDLHLPEEVSAMSTQAPVHISNAYFDWTSERQFRGNHATTTIHVTTLQSRVEARDVMSTRGDILKFDRVEPTNFVVRAADVKKTGILGIGGESLAAKLKSRQEDRISRIGKTIDGGTLTGTDLARAHCERGRALATLERNDDARRDGERAVELDSSGAPAVLTCRAAIRLATRDFNGAIEDASQAIVLGAEGEAYFVRARAEFALGRYNVAIEDFKKLKGDAGAGAPVRDLWVAMSYRRMGQPLPADLLAAAAATEKAPWPRSGLALFADRITPARLGELAQTKSGDEGEMNATEADFLVGEYYLAKGDHDEARRAFEAARGRGVVMYDEYNAAGVELDRLKPTPGR